MNCRSQRHNPAIERGRSCPACNGRIKRPVERIDLTAANVDGILSRLFPVPKWAVAPDPASVNAKASK